MVKALQILEWKEAAPLVYQVNPILAELIDKINPNKDYPMVKASYSFGDLIIKEGVLQIPSEGGKLKSLADDSLNKKIHADLNYSPIPLSLLLNKSSEIFLQDEKRTIPLNILKPGLLFGAFETTDFMFDKKRSLPVWNVSAGLRSVFMLPKISDFSGIKRLRNHYHISLDTQLKYLTQHWQVFKEISHSSLFSSPWKSEVLFFTKSWFTKTRDPKWFDLYHFLFKQSWEQVQYAIHELKTGQLWRECVQTIVHRRLKLTPYLIDTVRHLMTISRGLVPGFTSASSEFELPLAELQRAFTDIYLLSHYAPTILCPSLLGSQTNTLYYSLTFPTLPYNLSCQKINPASFMSEIKMIKLIIENLIKNHFNHVLFQNTKFEFFHTEKDQENEIKSSQFILEDPSFLENEKLFTNRHFCASSPFWRGCIQITSKDPTYIEREGF